MRKACFCGDYPQDLIPFSCCLSSSVQLHVCQIYVENYVGELLRVSIRCSQERPERSRSHPDGIPDAFVSKILTLLPFPSLPFSTFSNSHRAAPTSHSHSLQPRLSHFSLISTPSRAFPHLALVLPIR